MANTINPGAWVRLENPNYPQDTKVGELVNGGITGVYEGSYTTATIRLEDGTLYRNEGKVYRLKEHELLVTLNNDPRNLFTVRPRVSA